MHCITYANFVLAQSQVKVYRTKLQLYVQELPTAKFLAVGKLGAHAEVQTQARLLTIYLQIYCSNHSLQVHNFVIGLSTVKPVLSIQSRDRVKWS